MKILITGATGFLGSHLTRRLVKEGHEVIIVKRSFSDTWRIDDLLEHIKTFNTDECTLEKLFVEHSPIDIVIHTATMYDRENEGFSQLLDANVAFPLKLLELASLFNIKMFLNTDSFSHKNGIYTDHLGGYSLTKKQFLQWGTQFSKGQKIRFINMRLEHVYGPFDNEKKFSFFVMKSCLNNVQNINLTAGTQRRDFIYVDDVISAYSLLIKCNDNKQWFSEYQVGTGQAVPVREFAELIHKKTNSSSVLDFGSIPLSKDEIMESHADITNLNKIGWSSKVKLEEGIEKMISKEQELFKKSSSKGRL